MLIGGIGKIVVTVLAFSIIVSDAVFSIGENIGVFVYIEVGLVCII
jgi:hypothetical protein